MITQKANAIDDKTMDSFELFASDAFSENNLNAITNPTGVPNPAGVPNPTAPSAAPVAASNSAIAATANIAHIAANVAAAAAAAAANSSRKRSRAGTPTPTSRPYKAPTTISGTTATTTPSLLSSLGQQGAAVAAKLKDPIKRNGALNELLRQSAVNYILDGEAVVKELVSIVHECLDWKQSHSISTFSTRPEFRADKAWIKNCSSSAETWISHCQDRLSHRHYLMELEDLKCIEVVLVILRNLSFAAANARLLAFSPDILSVLVGCLYEGTFASSPANGDEISLNSTAANSAAGATPVLALPALQTLQNLSPHLDPEGQKLIVDKLFLTQKTDDGPLVPNPSTFGQAADSVWGFGSLWLAKKLDTKEDVLTDIPAPILLELTHASDYIVGVWSIFPALSYLFTDAKTPRSVLMQALELLLEFVNQARVGVVGNVEDVESKDKIPTTRAILVNMPDAVLDFLVDMLYVPRLGPDSLSYEDPTVNVVTRVTYLNLLVGYERTVDTDVRDRSLEVLLPLLEIDSPRMAERISVNRHGRVRTRLFDALVPCLGGQVGRSESSMLASQVLKELAKAGDGPCQLGLVYIKHRLVEMATRDARISQLVFVHLYPADSDDSDDDEDDSEAQEDTI